MQAIRARDRRTSSPTSIATSTATDDHERARTLAPRIRPDLDKLQVVAGALPVTTDHMAVTTFPRPISIHVVVTAARAPIGVAMRWRKRHPCSHYHKEHRGQDKGRGQEQGRAGTLFGH
jgi:hypothetical protein